MTASAAPALSPDDEMNELDRLMTEGLNAYQNGDYLKALKKFERYLGLEGEVDPVREAAAYTANRAQNWPRAADHWWHVAQVNPARLGPINQYVNALIRSQDYETADTFCQTNATLQLPKHLGTRDALRIRLHLAQGNVAEAARIAEESFADNPSSKVALDCARGFLDQKNYAQATAWLDRIDGDSREAAQVPMLRARLHYVQRHWSRAEAAFAPLAQGEGATDAEAKTARLFMARIALNQGQTAQAEERFRLVLADSPNHDEALTFFIRTALTDQDPATALDLLEAHWSDLNPVRRVQFKARALGQQDPEAADGVYRAAIEEFPDHLALQVTYGAFLLDMRNAEAAGPVIDAVLAAEPTNLEALRLRLRLLQLIEAPLPEQLEQAERVAARDPLNVTALNTVGGLFARCNRRGDAIDYYVRAVEIAPQAAVLWRNGAYHMAMENRLDDAARFAEAAIESLGTDGAEALADAAWISQAAGLTEAALDYASAAVAHDDSSLRAWEMLADLSMAQGDYARAWTSIQRVDALYAPRRSDRIAHWAAQCAAAFRTVAGPAADDAQAGQVHPIEGLFPETLFEALVARATPDTSGARAGIVHVTSNLGAGGAERQVAYVMQGLSADPIPGHGAALAVNSLEATNANDFFLADVTQSGLPVIDLEIQRQQAAVRQVMAAHPALRPQVQALASLPAELSRVALPLYAHLIETRPQVVHLWQDAINIAGGIAAVVAGVPQIVLCTRSTRPVEIRRYRRYLHAGYRALMGYAGEMTIVNNSANGARDYADWLNIPADQIGVFYNGYDFDALRASAAPGAEQAVRAEYGIPEDALVLGGVMRFSAEKRPDLWVETLLEAVAAEPKLYGMIVGDGPMRAALMDQVAAAGLPDRICFPGRQTPVVPFMRAMDMLFLSSVTEGLPNVLIEAQALGVPVATMDVGGATEAVNVGRSGIVLQEAAPADLAAQILTVLTDAEARTQMAAAAEDFATTQFALEAMIGTLKRSYGIGGDAPC